MANRKLSSVILILLLLALMIFDLATGITGLGDKGEVPVSADVERGEICEVNAVYATEVYYVMHMLSFIPTGMEHYYFVITEDDYVPLVIKEKKSWYKKNFDEISGFAYEPVTIRGKIEKLDHDFVSDFNDVNRDLSEIDASISTSLYIDPGYKKLAVLRLISGILLLAAAVMGFVFASTDRLTTKAGSAVVAFCIIAAVFSVFVMLFGETI